MTGYNKTMGRIRVEYSQFYGDASAVTIYCRAGWNDACRWTENSLSMEEVRDLRYMLDRMLAVAEVHQKGTV